jgi:hypothetical protein
MLKPFTFLSRLVPLALAGMLALPARAQTYTPVALTGFTHDIIANGTGAVSASTTADIDGAAATGGTGYALMAQDYVGPTGQVPNSTTYPATTHPALENSGLITSALNSAITYQLASYSANNALRLYGANATGTLSFATPSAASELYVIGTSGNANSALDITVNFADGSTQVFTGQTIADWFASGQPNVVREKLGRVSRGDNSVQYTGSPIVGPRFYQLRLALNAANVTKNITGITFVKPLAAGNTVLLAVTAGVLPVCAAAPTGLTTAATTTSGGTTALTAACSSTNIFLSLSGLANQAGYTYQWQSSANGTTWTNISGATGTTYTATGQTAATSYRALVACLYDGAGGTATPSAAVQIGQNAATDCYCIPAGRTSTSTSYSSVTNVSLPGDGGVTLTNAPGNITSTSAGYVSANYAVYPASTTTATLTQSANYTLTIAVPAFTRASVWVDYDRSGTFDASEFILLRNASGALYSSSAGNLTATITPPTTALAGTTRLRIRTDYYLNTVINTAAGACATTQYGQALDYFISIAAASACAGTPPAITTTASASTACGGTAFTLTAAGVAAGTTGLSYQFQSSPAGAGTFANLGAAQATNTYSVASQTAATDYRVVVTCTASGQSATSNTVAVAQTSFLSCYCAPVSTGTNEYIKSVTLPGTPGFTNATGANSTGGFGDFTASTANTTTLVQGATYTNGASVIVRSNNANSQGGLWIDYDHSGTFDAAEYTLVGTSSLTATDVTFPVTLTVPATALLGPTRVRVRWRSTAWYGESEDYLVTIAACTASPATFSYGPAATYCVSGATNPAVVLGTGASAGTFSSTAGLTLDATTGAISLASSTPGTYTVTNTVPSTTTLCGSTATTTITITAAPTASFSYAATTYCVSGVNNPAVVLGTGATAGTFSSVAGLTLNATTGAITLNSSTPGTYTITNSVAASGCAAVTSTASVTITAAPTASFSYPAAAICAGSSATLTPTLGTGATAGTYSLPTATGLSIDATTGIITVGATATAGTYTVNNTVPAANGCEAVTSTATFTLTAPATATFAFPAAAYCVSGVTTPTPTVTGTAGGTFSSTSGLSLNASTGAIDLSGSTPGTYTVTYAVSGTCGSSSTQTVTLTLPAVATFSYGASNIFCVNSATTLAAVLATGATAGTFSSAGGLTLNATTGAITLGSSTPGSYSVTNTVTTNGCTTTAVTTLQIFRATTATFSYATAAGCVGSSSSVTPTLAPGASGGTFSSTAGLTIDATTGAITLPTSTPGTYTVTNTVAASGCPGATATTTFTVNPRPATPTIAVAYNGTTTTLTSSATSGNQWYLAGGPVTGATGQTLVLTGQPAQLGSYTVTTTNASGCTSLPSTPLVVTSSAKALAGTTLTVYPNPTPDGRLVLELRGYREAVALTVLNALGQRVYEGTVAGSALTQQQTLNLSALPSGVYTLQARTASGGVEFRRIVRE